MAIWAEAGSTLPQIDLALEHLDALLCDVRAQALPLPIGLLQQRFQCCPLELRALLTVAAPALVPEISEQFSEVLASEPGTIPTRCLVELVAQSEEERELLNLKLASHAMLCRWQLLVSCIPRGLPQREDVPVLLRRLFVPERVLQWLRGSVAFDGSRFAHTATWMTAREGACLSAPEAIAQALGRVVFCEPFASSSIVWLP
jgi:hypothetical protein